MQSVIVLVLALCCKSSLQQSTEAPEGESRIYGGSSVDIKVVPYQVFLAVHDTPYCGGSIINTKYILTAAHCTTKIQHMDRINVKAGTSYTNAGGISRKLKKIIQHKSYSNKTKDYDYSILELKSPLELGASVKAVTLPEKNDDPKDGESCLVSGWGLTEKSTEKPVDLHAVKVLIVNRETCGTNRVHPVTDRMVCAGWPQGGRDACKGDSGGPLVCGNKLVGVVSWGNYKCGNHKSPSVYSRVAAVRDWIKETTGT